MCKVNKKWDEVNRIKKVALSILLVLLALAVPEATGERMSSSSDDSERRTLKTIPNNSLFLFIHFKKDFRRQSSHFVLQNKVIAAVTKEHFLKP